MATTIDTQRRYSVGAMIFHWLIAILVIMNWQIVERAHDLEGPLRGEVMGYHKAWGITILVLTVGRLLWRWAHPVPPLPSNLAAWEKTLARVVHVIFYVLLIGLPLGGWIANSLTGRELDYFGLFTIPALPVGQNEELGGSIFDLHALGGQIFLYLIALHVLGALKHTFFDRNGGIFRMLPFGKV
ncbi:MAG: cytochrome B [Citromicrobium sp.]|nr:MAG: cytochrome B [Citromicrobium sp.]